MNVLVLYNSTQTYTNTVFEHLNSFARFSTHRYFYCHHDRDEPLDVDLSRFDAVVIHYCLRLPFDQVSESAAQRLADYPGLKVLFIQDEYDHTYRAWSWIRRLGIGLVFTVVPADHIGKVYPAPEFPGVRFVSNLTGYVPEALVTGKLVAPPSTRRLLVGYRGRPLPMRYGRLGQEKVEIGRMVKAYCDERGLPCDVAWSEEARIYGPRWYEFMVSCRGMLGSESGSNVFDWEGDLTSQAVAYRAENPQASDQQVYEHVVAPREMPGVMNQISPRVFEAISFRTVLVLFEGRYSGVIEPWEHYIPLAKDGANLDEVFARLADEAFVDAMAERAWQHVIGSGHYGYPQFVQMADHEIESDVRARSRGTLDHGHAPVAAGACPSALTSTPIRSPAPDPFADAAAGSVRMKHLRNIADSSWALMPPAGRRVLRPVVRAVLRPGWRLFKRLRGRTAA